jgi:hypothetical protein
MALLMTASADLQLSPLTWIACTDGERLGQARALADATATGDTGASAARSPALPCATAVLAVAPRATDVSDANAMLIASAARDLPPAWRVLGTCWLKLRMPWLIISSSR